MLPNTEKRVAISPARSADGSRRTPGVQDPQLATKAYRRYAAGIERALGLFDSALQEWADYIAFLGRLQKALQAQPGDVNVIPDKRTVARRLAQCLNPSLPSGVHQKTLELYDLVLTLQGQDNLSRDLSLYLPGISSTLTFASLKVRPIFLSLVEDHLLKLPITTLRPALKAVILSLLPGIEDETSEDFDRVLDILDKFRGLFNIADTEGIFWQCLFLASITSPSRRLGALAYLTRRLPKLESNAGKLASSDSHEVVVALTDPEPGLLVRCFSTGLSDEQILVQRTFLDLLVTHLPLNAGFYDKVTTEDMRVLVTSAISVVLRRDMSLNRRLWSWFLGPENQAKTNDQNVPISPEEINKQIGSRVDVPTSDNGSNYFEFYGLNILVASLESMIARRQIGASERAQPLRIALSLMDRWEIGGPVVAAVFLPLMRSVEDYVHAGSSPEAVDLVLRSASIFFDGVESGLIWSRILQLVDTAAQDDLRLANFIVTTFNIRELEMVRVHIPMVTLALLCVLRDQKRKPLEEAARPSLTRSHIVGLVEVIAPLIADSAFEDSVSTERVLDAPSTTFEVIKAFYTEVGGSLTLPRLPFTPSELGRLILRYTASLFISYFDDEDDLLEQLARIVVTVSSRVSDLSIDAEIAEKVVNKMVSGEAFTDFSVLSATASVAASVCTSHEHLAAIVPALVERLWNFLSPTTPQHHIDAVRQIWALHAVSSHSRLVESKITSLMISPGARHTPEHEASANSSYSLRVNVIQRFGVLWNHSNTVDLAKSALDGPLALVIDCLASSSGESAAKEWLQGAPALSLARVFRLAILPLIQFDTSEMLNTALQRLAGIISAQSPQQFSRFAYEPQWAKEVLVNTSIPQVTETLQTVVTEMCILIVEGGDRSNPARDKALSLLKDLLKGPAGVLLVSEQLEVLFISKLDQSLQFGDTKFQTNLIEGLLAFLELKLNQLQSIKATSTPKPQHRRLASREKAASDVHLSPDTETRPSSAHSMHSMKPSPELLACVRKGLTSDPARSIIDKWVTLLCELVPLYSRSMYQILIALVESLCEEITKTFAKLQFLFPPNSRLPLPLVHWGTPESNVPVLPVREDLEWVLSHLLNGLEYILAQAHLQLAADESQLVSAKTPDQPQGLFGSMVSGSSTGTEGNQIRNTIANNRLTVILCFQDSVRVLVNLWSWEKLGLPSSPDSVASFQYLSSKLRHRSRRILEHLLEAEPLEGLETLVELWVRSVKTEPVINTPVIDLFQTLNASRPRTTVPVVFNAIYSRTNPTVLNKHQRSTLSSNITENELVSFLVQYSSSLEDDVLEEIWTDCTTFLRDVLGNPMPHRRILPGLLEFIAVIGRKMENTNFGEESKMRRELGVGESHTAALNFADMRQDLFVRLLTAIFTISPGGQGTDNAVRVESRVGLSQRSAPKHNLLGFGDVVEILCDTLPSMNHMLGESDRLVGLVTSISAQIFGPMTRSRLFPRNISQPLLKLMHIISKISNASKPWKKDLYDFLNDPRFFQNSPTIVREGWLPVLAQLNNADKGLLTELSSRLTTPAAAGLMFGVGASAARLEADRKTQLNLRRLAIVILAAEDDTINIETFRSKIEETLTATRVSSPSSITRAEVFVLIRALALKSTSTQLASVWPAISAELHDVFSSVIEDKSEAYNGFSLLQAAKLLDLLLVVQPDEFQLHEWLFVTDTLDAIYPPDDWHSSALIDEVAESANQSQTPMTPHPGHLSEPFSNDLRRPWLCSDATRGVDQGDVLVSLLLPFFGQLSIHAFESTYSLGVVDREACVDDLIADLFNDETIAA